MLAASHHRTLAVPNLPELAPNDPTGPRFLVEDIYPGIDGGRYPLKRIAAWFDHPRAVCTRPEALARNDVTNRALIATLAEVLP